MVSPPACRRFAATLAALCAVACQADLDKKAEGKVLDVNDAAVTQGLRRTTLANSKSEGLSGLAVDETGAYVAIPERQRHIVRFREAGEVFAVESVIPLNGVRDGLDTESIAFLSPGHFAVGTETHHSRREDAILLVEATATEAHVTDEVELDYNAWGQRAGINHGIEALCAAAGSIIVGTEVVVAEKGRRYAPIARYDFGTHAWSYGKLWLTSNAGKLSSFECKARDDNGIQVLAIERHFGVGRLVRFDVPADGELQDITAVVALDLLPLVQPLPNFEGIAWDKNGDIVLLTDNSNVIVDKPTEVYVIPKGSLAP